MRTRLFVVAACLSLLVCLFAIPASAESNTVEISGRWQFNDVVGPYNGPYNSVGNADFKFSFLSNDKQYSIFQIYGCADDGWYLYFRYMTGSVSGTKVYTPDSGWANEQFKLVDFGDEAISVPSDFYDWFSANAIWLDKPNPMQELVGGIGAVFTGAIGWTGVVATTVSNNPLLLLFSIIGFIGIGIVLFNRLTNK